MSILPKKCWSWRLCHLPEFTQPAHRNREIWTWVFLTPEPTVNRSHKYLKPMGHQGSLRLQCEGIWSHQLVLFLVNLQAFKEHIKVALFFLLVLFCSEKQETRSHIPGVISARHWRSQLSRVMQAFLWDAPRLGLPLPVPWLPAPPTKAASLWLPELISWTKLISFSVWLSRHVQPTTPTTHSNKCFTPTIYQSTVLRFWGIRQRCPCPLGAGIQDCGVSNQLVTRLLA